MTCKVGIQTHDLLVGDPSLNQLSYAQVGVIRISIIILINKDFILLNNIK